MKTNLGKGKTALVSGPASLSVLSGNVSCLGAKVDSHVIVRKDKRLPFLAEADSVIDVLQAPDSDFFEADTDTIPGSWHDLAGKISKKAEFERQIVLIVGAVDSGKTTLTVFLTNRLYASGVRVAVINLDVGQSDFGPPTTVGLKFVSRPVVDFFLEKPDRIEFVGSTTPTACRELITRYAGQLVLEASKQVDVILVNTDGWIGDFEAVEFKTTLLKTSRATAAVLISGPEDLSSFADAAERIGITVYPVERSRFAASRTREERRRVREQSYQRYLEYAASRILPSSLVDGSLHESVEGRLLGLFDTAGKFVSLGVAQRIVNGKLILRTPFRGRVTRVMTSTIRLVNNEEIVDNN